MSFTRAGALALLLASVGTAGIADASVSRAVLFEDLVRDARSVDVVTPTEQRSVWEGGRIVTYTRVRVDRAIAGDLGAGADTWVRSLGGVVGSVGQLVDGEPALAVGAPTLLFLREGPAGAMQVTARAQGQFALVPEGGGLRVRQSGAVGVLLSSVKPWRTYVPAAGLALASIKDAFAGDVLHGRPLDDAAADIGQAWKRAHAH